MDDGNHKGGEVTLSWRALVFAPLMLALFFLALWFNGAGAATRALICLGLTFSIAMVWVILAARASDNPDSPLRRFIPRMTIFLVLGTAFLAASRWSTDRRISAMEAGFAALYIIAAYVAMRSFGAGRKRPHLTAVADRKRSPGDS
jgi:hypothetical protein